MLKTTKTIFTLLAALMLSASAHATLIGDSVTIEYISSTGSSSGAASYIVGAGNEGNFFGNQTFNFGALSFEISSSSSFGGIFSTNSNDSITLALSSLDFGAALTAVELTTNLTGVIVDFGADFANFTWSEQNIPQGFYLGAEFSTGNVTSVAEPSSLALIGLGLVGFGIARRRMR